MNKKEQVILQFDIQLASRLYNLLKDEKYGFIYVTQNKCPECEGEKVGISAEGILLCHVCKRATAIIYYG